jgi:hypothetical protein
VTLELFGVTLHEADVALTDVALALLGGVCAWKLWRRPARTPVQRDGAVINAGLAAAAFGGAVFHAFFPAKVGTPAGYTIWLLTTAAIALAAATMLLLAWRLVRPHTPWLVRGGVAAGYAISFVATIALIDPSYRTVVLFYGPVLLALLVAAVLAARQSPNSGWRWIAMGLALSVVAAVLQQQRVAAHPVYFDHNALYHLVQAIALVVLYRGLRAA